MAKITMTIEADSADDLKNTMRLLAGASLVAYTAQVVTAEELEQPTATQTEDAEPGEPKRTRRTKNTAKPSAAEPETPSQPTATDVSSETKEAGGSDAVDPFGDQSPDTSSDSPASEPTVTLADLKERLKAYLGNHDAADAKKVLSAYGVGNLGALAAEHYGAVYAALGDD